MSTNTTEPGHQPDAAERTIALWREWGKVEKSCAVLLVLWLLAETIVPENSVQWVLRLLLVVFASWTFLRWAVAAMRGAIWRLRNRLVVAYLVMAAVPVILILLLAMVSANILASHLAVFLANSELERRVETLRSGASSVMRFPPEQRIEPARRLAASFADQYAGFELIVDGASPFVFPDESTLTAPPAAWGESSGVMVHDQRLHLWARSIKDDGSVTLIVPVTRGFLATMIPQMGEIYIADLEHKLKPLGITAKIHDAVDGEEATPAHPVLQQKKSFFDQDISWFMTVPLAVWEKPGEAAGINLAVNTRLSLLVNLIVSSRGGGQEFTQAIMFAFYALVILFVLVEMAALVIGISITRSMTSAVHNLYEGTLRVQQEDFAHRIQVQGTDQVAALSDSFNSMTTKIEQLLVVAKEKERLQTEVAIAREVQAQLFPRELPDVASIELTAVCNAARSVSGDYYDFRQLGTHRVAMAMGDVAGKGISAALLMATLASSLRTQLGHWLESDCESLSTSGLVSKLNKHLYAHTSPEKYATFCLGIYNHEISTLTYTNAGHLPPILIRNGEASLFDVNGMVVGAFPFAQYEESQLKLEANDVIVFYTDGITEPENEYGEMFGEERLLELVTRHAGCTNSEIIQHIVDAVHLWTYDKDSMDDMTLLVARRK